MSVRLFFHRERHCSGTHGVGVSLNPRVIVPLVGVVAGVAIGVGGYTFVYAKGYSYLSSDPAACANCHIMREHFDAWMKGPHRHVAVCNDCHTPHDPVRKYAVKASNGFWHSFGFTTGRFPDPLRIKPGNHKVTEAACRRCHEPIVAAMDALYTRGGEISCVRCHANVGHLRE